MFNIQSKLGVRLGTENVAWPMNLNREIKFPGVAILDIIRGGEAERAFDRVVRT
jgi:hypothetical protein